jgi:hypothetical protein
MVKKGKRSYQYFVGCRTGSYIDNLLLKKDFVTSVAGNGSSGRMLPADDLPVKTRVL